MITYPEWRAKYVERNENGLYVNYNAQGLSHPKDAITVSEASGCVTRIESSVLGARVLLRVMTLVLRLQIRSASQRVI